MLLPFALVFFANWFFQIPLSTSVLKPFQTAPTLGRQQCKQGPFALSCHWYTRLPEMQRNKVLPSFRPPWQCSTVLVPCSPSFLPGAFVQAQNDGGVTFNAPSHAVRNGINSRSERRAGASLFCGLLFSAFPYLVDLSLSITALHQQGINPNGKRGEE